MTSVRRFELIDAPDGDSFVSELDLRLLDSEPEFVRLEGRVTGRDGDLAVQLRQGTHVQSFPAGDGIAYRLQDASPVEVFATDGTTERLLGRVEIGGEQDGDTFAPAPMSPKAVRGRNDFLFLGGDDANALMEHMNGQTPIRQPAIDIHEHNFGVIGGLRCPHMVLIVPEAHILYEELLPDGVTVSDNRPIRTVLERHGSSVWYPLDFMRDLKADGVEVYTGNDSHWSEFASFPVYDEMRRRMGRDFPMTATLKPSHLREVRDLRIVSREEVIAREKEARNNTIGTNYRFFFSAGILNHGNVSAMYNPEGRGKLLAFGTSFSTRLVPAYASDFRDVVFCYGTTVDPMMVDLMRPDAVLVEMPERFVHFPAAATRGATLMSSLISSHAEDYPGLAVDRFDAMPEGVTDLLRVARGLLRSREAPEELSDALDLLGRYDPVMAARMATIAAVVPNVTNKSAFRVVISGGYMNTYSLVTIWQAIDAGELDGVDPDIFPNTEMGMLARIRYDLHSGRKDEARKRFAAFTAWFGETELARHMAAALNQPD